MCGYASDNEYQEAKTEYATKYKDYKKLETTVENLQKDNQQLMTDYQSEMKKVNPDIMSELQEKREDARAEMETVAKSKLQEKYGYGFEEGKFADARNATDEKLGIEKKRVNIKDMIQKNKTVAPEDNEQIAEIGHKKVKGRGR